MRRPAALLASLAVFALIAATPDAIAQGAAPSERFSDKMNAEVIDKALSGVVKLRTVAAPAARSNAILGAEREGNGVLLSPRLVLTIGYLIMEADEVEITDHKGRKLPGKVAAFDQQTGFGLVRLLAPAQGAAAVAGRCQRSERKRPGARRWSSGQCCASVRDVPSRVHRWLGVSAR